MPTTATPQTGDVSTEHQHNLFLAIAERPLILGLLLAVVTLAVFISVSRQPFLNCDDDIYVTANPQIQQGLTAATLRWALTSTQRAGLWHPLTWISHALDFELFGLNPAGHHLTNLFLHILNVLLLFFLVQRGTGKTLASF